jgi:hypothetical protein
MALATRTGELVRNRRVVAWVCLSWQVWCTTVGTFKRARGSGSQARREERRCLLLRAMLNDY